MSLIPDKFTAILPDIASVAVGSPDEAPHSHLVRHFSKKRKRDSGSEQDQSDAQVETAKGGQRVRSLGSNLPPNLSTGAHPEIRGRELDVVERGILSEEEAKELYSM